MRPNVWLNDAGVRSARFHALGGSAFLRADRPDDVRRVLDDLPGATRDTFRIVERDELDTLGADPDAPFALAAAPGFVIDDRREPPAMQPNPGMSHGHHPDMADMHTGFVAKGAGIRAGVSIPLLHLTSIAPIVAELLGLDFEAPDGVMLPGLLEN